MANLSRCLTRILSLPLSLAALTLFVGAPLAADETGASARAIADKHGAAVVPVRVVIKMRVAYEGEEVDEEENSNELTATVIDPSGLALCALSEVDPTHMIELWQEEDPNYDIDAQVTDLKFVFPDGKEVPAKVVLRDRDLDLAFIRPTALPDTPFTAVDLTQAAQPELMDEIVVLGRLGDVANRELWLALDRITAIVTKPRTLYIAGLDVWVAGLGVPAFTLDGRLVGITVMRAIPTAGSVSGRGNTSVPVVMPANGILEVAQQAPPA